MLPGHSQSAKRRRIFRNLEVVKRSSDQKRWQIPPWISRKIRHGKPVHILQEAQACQQSSFLTCLRGLAKYGLPIHSSLGMYARHIPQPLGTEPCMNAYMARQIEHLVDGTHGFVQTPLPDSGDAPDPSGISLVPKFPPGSPVEFEKAAPMGVYEMKVVLMPQKVFPLTGTQGKPGCIQAPAHVLQAGLRFGEVLRRDHQIQVTGLAEPHVSI